MCHIEKASKRRFEAITAKKGGNARPFKQASPLPLSEPVRAANFVLMRVGVVVSNPGGAGHQGA